MTRPCPACAYDLSRQATGGRCPECGSFEDLSVAAVRKRARGAIWRKGGPVTGLAMALVVGLPLTAQWWNDSWAVPALLIVLAVAMGVATVGGAWLSYQLLPLPRSGAGKVLATLLSVQIVAYAFVFSVFVAVQLRP